MGAAGHAVVLTSDRDVFVAIRCGTGCIYAVLLLLLLQRARTHTYMHMHTQLSCD
jgi:hypothetical protein